MARRTITKDELDAELDGGADPIRELPVGFPSSHSRFPAIPSQAFVESASADEASEPEVAASLRDDVRSRIARFLPPYQSK